MFIKCAILLFELVFFFNTIKYNVVEAAGQDLTVQVMFVSGDQASETFIKEQLASVFESLSNCVTWDFHPLHATNYPGGQQSDLNDLYYCARHYYNLIGYKLAKFYVCMITASGGEQLSQGPACAMKAGIDWEKVSHCTSPQIGIGNHLEILLNDKRIPDITTKFKEKVCAQLVSLNTSCACCPH